MSDDYVEPSSDSFWEIGQYKRTVKRCEDGNKLCNDIVQMISERADIEKTYSKNLKAWSKKWNDYLTKGSEYGTMKSTWMSALNEADKLADIHLTTNNVLTDELNNEIKQFQKSNYPKTIVSQIKIAKEYEEEFKKAQKAWSKKYLVVEKTKKDYHSACKSFQSAKIQFANSQNDSAISPDQKKKLEDKVEKYKKEVEVTKNKYKQSLDDLNSSNSRYIEDMTAVYKRCDSFEKERLEFFIEKFIKLHNHLNIYEKSNIESIYTDFYKTIKQTNPDRDLVGWSKEYGAGMAMNWPVFEEYSEELKTIAKGRSKIAKDLNSDSNGVTMTSIKLKTDENENADTRSMSVGPESARDPWADSTASYSSQRSNEFAASFEDFNNNNQQTATWNSDSKLNTNHIVSNNNIESVPNPFGEFDEEDQSNQLQVNTESDEETSSSLSQKVNYLSVKVRALYDYQSAEEDELSFKAGEEFIKLANEDDRGWCLGKIGSKIGLYPATYATNA